ncbi:MAG TPA: hypothetical protein VE689_05470 [Candidatus Udaeobacter sp.]|jgi:hypothetical protein|nr:hypothetical protein [Candidatus Udaeobacter sp.]
MKIKELDNWPPQEWNSDGKTLAPEDALDGTDVSASIQVDEPNVIALTVTHNDESYAALLRIPEDLVNKVTLVISGAGPNKTLRDIGDLDLDSEVSD